VIMSKTENINALIDQFRGQVFKAASVVQDMPKDPKKREQFFVGMKELLSELTTAAHGLSCYYSK